MCALQGNRIVDISLDEATSELKTVDMDMYKLAHIFFG